MNTWMLQINPLAATWLDAIWRASWQASIAFALVWAVCRVFKNLPARAKSWLWRLAYLKLLVAFLWATPISLPLLPAKAGQPTLGARPLFSAPAISSPLPPLISEVVPAPAAPAPSAASTATSALPSPTGSAPSLHVQPTLADWLLLVWALGLASFGVCTWRKLRHVRRAQRACAPVTDPALLQCSAELARCFRLFATPTLLLSDAAGSPMLLRTLRPVIVLPSAFASGSSPEHLRLMLAHEMAHVKRFDLWWAWLAVAGEGLFFFHPLLWLARRQWRLAQEMACDELAVRVTRAPVSTYGDMLVGAAALNLASHHEPLLVTLGLTETKVMLVKRLNAMKLIKLNSTKRTVLTAAAILAAGILSVLPWRLTAQPSSDAPASGPTTSRGRGGFGGGTGFSEGGSSSLSARSSTSTTPPANVAPARFEATIYELTVPENRIADLDAVKLESEAGTPAKLAAFMGGIGTVRILYKVDQTVNLYGEHISLGTQEPMVSNTRKDAAGNTLNSITYTTVGLRTEISATPPDDARPGDPKVQLNFQLSALTSSGVEISSGVPASSIRNVQLAQSGTPKFGKPSVLLSVSAAGASEKAPPVAYIVRYLFTQPKP